MKQYIVILIMLFLLFPHPLVIADKIQENEKWSYIDSDGKKYNETALRIIQKTTKDTVVALGEVNTTRPFSFPIDLSIGILTFNLTIGGLGSLFITQEGGYPIYANRSVSGDIKISGSTVYSLNSTYLRWIVVGNPSRTFGTAESETYMLQVYLMEEPPEYFIYMRLYFIISTNQVETATVRNYTITNTHTFVDIDLKNRERVTFGSQPQDGLALSQSLPDTLITWNSLSNLPTYIQQSEPLLQQLSFSEQKTVEYFLVEDLIETSTQKEPFIFPFLLILVPVLVKYARKLNKKSL